MCRIWLFDTKHVHSRVDVGAGEGEVPELAGGAVGGRPFEAAGQELYLRLSRYMYENVASLPHPIRTIRACLFFIIGLLFDVLRIPSLT